MKLEIDYKKIGKRHKNVEIKHSTEQPVRHQRNQRRNKPKDKWKQKYGIPRSMGSSKSGYKREVHSNTGLPQGTIYHLWKIVKIRKEEKKVFLIWDGHISQQDFA